MAQEIRVPALGESISEATVAQWFKKEGDAVTADEPLVELETDKVTLEVPAPAAGVLSEITARDGDVVGVDAVLGSITQGSAAVAPKKAEAAPGKAASEPPANGAAHSLSPAVRKLIEENNLDPAQITGTGKDGRLVKGDVLAFLEKGSGSAAPQRVRAPVSNEPREERIRMTRLRQTIAKRLKDAQNVAAMLTTFNEVDMSEVMALRTRYKELFEKKHGIKLGFMGLFVRACVTALKDVPAVNAEIDGTDLVYKNYCNIGVAVGTDKGLVVPVVRDADQMSIADIEKTIAALGSKAREGKLSLDDMMGGTFTVSNGGVYGSLMSTPILNAPQSGILGMHKIQPRPMAIDGEVVIRPMMYLALSYDHRIVDGKEAVTFLVRVKEALEDPQRLVLDL